MKKNEIFNFGRFRKYFAKDLLRCAKQVGLATLLTGLIPIIFLFCAACICTATGIRDWNFDIFFTTGIAAAASVLYFLFMPISCYGELTDKRKGSSFLMLPASHTEKYVSMLVNCLIIFPLAFVVLYLGLDALCATMFPTRYESIIVTEILGEEGDEIGYMTFFLHAMVSAAGLCGAVLFKKRKASKTFLACAVSFIVFVIILLTISERADGAIMADMFFGTHSWYIFQAFCTLCLLTYVYVKTKKIQL